MGGVGKAVHDSETPAHGQQVITACAFIHRKVDGVQKVFLPKRAETKKFLPGFLELPGGHIDFDEEIVDGLVREINEEFGMGTNVGDPFAAFTYVNEVKGAHAIEVVYFAQFADPVDQITLNPEDHSEFDWFSEEEVIANRDQLVAQDQVGHEYSEDPEYQTILRGFQILGGEATKFC